MKKAFFLFFFAFVQLNADPDFDESIGIERLGTNFICKKDLDKTRYELYKRIWNANKPKAKEKIPQIIHILGKPSEEILASWKKNHPKWEILLWPLDKMPEELAAIDDPEERGIVDQKFFHVVCIKFTGLGQVCHFHDHLLDQFGYFCSQYFITNDNH